MTDWMPWGFVFSTGVFVTLGLLLKAVATIPQLDAAMLRRAHRTYWATVALSYASFTIYLVFQERWIWY